MKTLFRNKEAGAALFKALLLVVVVGVVLAFAATAADTRRAGDTIAFNTDTAGTSQLVTNKVLAYNITSYGGTNAPYPILSTAASGGGGLNVYVQFHQRYTTTTIPSTNTTYVFQTSGDGIYWDSSKTITVGVAGAAVDGAFTDTGTNLVVNGAQFIRLYSVLPLAPMTNSYVKVFAK